MSESDEVKLSDTYKVEHDPLTDAFTGGEGTQGERVETHETHDGTTDTYEVNHDALTDLFTGGEGTKGDRITTTEEHND